MRQEYTQHRFTLTVTPRGDLEMSGNLLALGAEQKPEKLEKPTRTRWTQMDSNPSYMPPPAGCRC